VQANKNNARLKPYLSILGPSTFGSCPVLIVRNKED
jgi:hypothetical protein